MQNRVHPILHGVEWSVSPRISRAGSGGKSVYPILQGLQCELTHFASYVDNLLSTPYRPRDTVAYTEGERYAESTAPPPPRGLPASPSVALFQSPEPRVG